MPSQLRFLRYQKGVSVPVRNTDWFAIGSSSVEFQSSIDEFGRSCHPQDNFRGVTRLFSDLKRNNKLSLKQPSQRFLKSRSRSSIPNATPQRGAGPKILDISILEFIVLIPETCLDVFVDQRTRGDDDSLFPRLGLVRGVVHHRKLDFFVEEPQKPREIRSQVR